MQDTVQKISFIAMKKRYFLFIIILLLSFSSVFSRSEKTEKNKFSEPTGKKTKKIKWKVKPDSLYVKDYDDLLNVTLPFSSRYLKVNLTDKNTNKVLNFRPHGDLTVGLNVGYKFLGLGYSVSTGTTSADDKTYGKTRYTDYSFSFSGHRYVLDLYYEDFKGFYLNNYKSFPPESKADTSRIFPQRSDMRATSAGLAFNYIQNYKHFSYQAAFGNSEEQLHCAGSFLYGIYVSTFNLSADSGLVTGKYKKYLYGYSNIDHSTTFNVGLSAGYIYTYVFKHHWYATLALNPGLSFLYYESHAYGPKDTSRFSKDSTYNVKTNGNLGFKFQSRFALGYNSPKWYAGIFLTGDAFFQDAAISKSSVNYAIGSFQFYVGYRFNAPYLKKIWPKRKSQIKIKIEGESSS